MFEKIWKGALLALSFILLSALIFFGKTAYTEYSEQITGRQYLKIQQKYVNEFAVFADDIDDIITLYLMGTIDEDDFLTYIDTFQAELDLILADYENDAEIYPVREGSHTYYTKYGCDAVADCFEIYEDILEMLEEYSSDTDEMSYRYLTYQQEIISAMAKYTAAVELEFGDEAESASGDADE